MGFITLDRRPYAVVRLDLAMRRNAFCDQPPDVVDTASVGLMERPNSSSPGLAPLASKAWARPDRAGSRLSLCSATGRMCATPPGDLDHLLLPEAKEGRDIQHPTVPSETFSPLFLLRAGS